MFANALPHTDVKEKIELNFLRCVQTWVKQLSTLIQVNGIYLNPCSAELGFILFSKH